MKKSKTIILLSICVVIAMGLIAYSVLRERKDNPTNNYVTRGIVAKDVSLLSHSVSEVKKQDRKYVNKHIEEWYAPYAEMMYQLEYFEESYIRPTEAELEETFTYKDLDELFTNIGVVDKKLLAFVNNNKASDKITNKEWTNIFELLVENFDIEGKIKKQQFIIVGTPSNISTMGKWEMATTIGKLSFEGLNVDYYIDKEVSAFVKDGELLLIGEEIKDKICYDNSYIISVDGGNIKAYISGVIREFVITDKTSNYSNIIGDLDVEAGKLISYNFKNKAVSGKVLTSDKTGIELEKSGYYEVAENVKVYKTFGAMEMMSIRDILVGYDVGQYFVEDGKIVAAVIDRDTEADNIRVLIMNTGFSEIYHDEIILSAPNGMKITWGDNEMNVKTDEEVKLLADDKMLEKNRVKIEASGMNGKIGINSIQRGYGTPFYRGTLEIAKVDGRMIIVNELPVEKYLLNVVPSEMPYTYNIEALKAQAVCARSYAIKQIKQNGYSKYGAHVDDSTNYQVYNNSAEQESSTQAVEETYGKVIMYEDDIINAYFYSTSCGSSTDAKVWGNEVPYIEGRLLSDEETEMDLSDEMTFQNFIRTSYSTYDSEYPWYRWSVELSLDEIGKLVNNNLGAVCNGSPKCVSIKKNNKFVNEYVAKVGKIKKIEVGNRGYGGVLNYIIIYGSEATVKVERELNIRKLFNLNGYTIKRLNGSDVTDFGLLPSAYAIFDPISEDNILSGYKIIGGGYGHGVGLSQNGANYLGKSGSNFDEIIRFFYKDVKVEKMY